MGNLSKEKLIQNLRDAGCDDSTIKLFFTAMDLGEKNKAMQYIKKYREKLLEEFHKCSNSIDCLDYFILQIEKNYKQGENL